MVSKDEDKYDLKACYSVSERKMTYVTDRPAIVPAPSCCTPVLRQTGGGKWGAELLLPTRCS